MTNPTNLPDTAPHDGDLFTNNKAELGHIGCTPADTDDNGEMQDEEIEIAPGATWRVFGEPYWINGEWTVTIVCDAIPGHRGYVMDTAPPLALFSTGHYSAMEGA